MRYFVLLMIFSLAVPAAFGKSLQQAYDEAGSGGGYDKLLVLDPNEVYTGRCEVLAGKKSCIRGNGALCDLKDNQIYAGQSQTELYLTGCCIINGYSNSGAVAVYYGANAIIDGNTICKSGMGIMVWRDSTATVKNNIIWGNTKYGIAKHEYTSGPTILYDDVSNNPGGNYMYQCVG
jgi:parallel beta-helix repeat protein